MTDTGAWWFQRQRASDKHRDPTQGEYFRTSADSLIRESIQNSLDASPDGQLTKVAIHVSQEGLPSTPEVRELFAGLTDHLSASAGHSHVVTPLPPNCRFISIEDFGTRGLRGDPEECFDPEVGQDFYHFFRAEGRTGKSAGGRGSWEYGKYTFVKASIINTFFGVTVPDDGNRPSALGQSVLTNHQVDGKHFKPDGWWGQGVVDDEHGEFSTSFGPDTVQYRKLCEAFGLTRTIEPGLSVVVPYLDKDITSRSVITALLDNYLPSLVFGELEVTVTSDIEDSVLLNRGTVRAIVQGRDDSNTIAPLLEMAEKLDGTPDMVLQNVATSPSWDEYDLVTEDGDRIEEWLQGEDTFSVRVPLMVSPKSDKSPTESYLDICFTPSPGERSKPAFFREGIRVTEASLESTVRARSMVWITHPPLALMLGLAESPAHTKWQSDSDRFRGNYSNGRNWISFVKRAPLKLLDRASAGRRTEDRRALASFFPATPVESKRRSPADGTPSPEGASSDRKLTIEERVLPFRISPFRSNGFTVRFSDQVELGSEAEVVVAYDALRGNPFVKWTPLDFDVADLSLEESGLTVLERSGQRIRVRVDKSGPELDVWGFNRSLDVIVRCEVSS